MASQLIWRPKLSASQVEWCSIYIVSDGERVPSWVGYIYGHGVPTIMASHGVPRRPNLSASRMRYLLRCGDTPRVPPWRPNMYMASQVERVPSWVVYIYMVRDGERVPSWVVYIYMGYFVRDFWGNIYEGYIFYFFWWWYKFLFFCGILFFLSDDIWCVNVCVWHKIYIFFIFFARGGYPPLTRIGAYMGYMGFLVFFGVFGCPRGFCSPWCMVFGLASGNVQAVVYGVYIFFVGVKMGVLWWFLVFYFLWGIHRFLFFWGFL